MSTRPHYNSYTRRGEGSARRRAWVRPQSCAIDEVRGVRPASPVVSGEGAFLSLSKLMGRLHFPVRIPSPPVTYTRSTAISLA